MQQSRITQGTAKTKKKKALPIKKKTASVTQRIVVFADNDSDNYLTNITTTQHGQDSEAFPRPEI